MKLRVIQFFSALAVAFSPSISFAETIKDLVILEHLMNPKNTSLEFFHIDMAAKKCRQVSRTSVSMTKEQTNLYFSGTQKGEGSFNLKTGAYWVPYNRLIEVAVRSDARETVNRCVSDISGHRIATFKQSKKTKENVPYLWTFAINERFCARMGVYTDCRIDCRLNVPRGAEVFAMTYSKKFAEELAGKTCEK